MTPTLETLCDFAIDYVEHTVRVKIGAYGAATDKTQLSKTVDFNKFFTATGASHLTLTLASISAGLLAIAF